MSIQATRPGYTYMIALSHVFMNSVRYLSKLYPYVPPVNFMRTHQQNTSILWCMCMLTQLVVSTLDSTRKYTYLRRLVSVECVYACYDFCSLRNDAFSIENIPRRIAGWYLKDELEKIWKSSVLKYSKYCPWICLEGRRIFGVPAETRRKYLQNMTLECSVTVCSVCLY
jgi:hypothetical protein